VLAEIQMGETVSVTTSVVGYRKVWARRRTEVARVGGALVAHALTDWVITDAEGAPTRVPDEFVHLFGFRVETFTPGRVVLPPSPPDVHRRTFDVRAADIDPMAHVNNAAYIDYLDESAAAAGESEWTVRVPRRYRLEYAAAAGPGDRLGAETWAIAEGIAHRLRGADQREILRATIDSRTDRDAIRSSLTARRAWHAPGKDANAG
jgi:acyl-ACP thioesterase